MKTTSIKLFLLCTTLFIQSASALDDIEGASDFPKLPRIDGSSIVAFHASNYNSHQFALGVEGREFLFETNEGDLTRLVYALPLGQSPLFALRNYQEAFAEFGEVTEKFQCTMKACGREFGNRFIWSKNKRISSPYKSLNHIYAISAYHKNGHYWHAKIASEDASYVVSVYAAQVANNRYEKDEGLVREQTLVHVDILQRTGFKSDLELVTASDIQSTINDKGHIALYGLYFDTDSDQLKDTSKPALDEVAKAIGQDQGLKLYIVGHTDNEGSLEHNQQLSKRRATSVVKSLISSYGIEQQRLTPLGVGLAAPVASNETEAGRALNRRVELVKK